MLADQSPVGDTLLVLLNPIEKPSAPRTAREIAGDVSRVTFSQPLLRDVAEIEALRGEHRVGMFRRQTRSSRIAAHRFHLIEAGRHTGSLSPETKMRPDKALLAALNTAGREEARRWVGRHLADIGRRRTVDLAATFLTPLTSLRSAEPEALPETEPQAAQVPNL